jgi:hypothetical protein
LRLARSGLLRASIDDKKSVDDDIDLEKVGALTASPRNVSFDRIMGGKIGQ